MEFKLIIKKLNKTLSEEEIKKFDAWYKERPAHRQYFNNVKDNYGKDLSDVDVEEGWKQLMTRIDAEQPKNNFWKYAVAATVVVLLGLIWMFNQGDMISIDDQPIIVNNNIEAGTNKATLTLDDGLVVTLEKGKTYRNNNASSNGEKLVYSESTSNKNEAPEIVYNYLTIPRGGEFFLQLADGTRVWLNSDSKLKYPTQFIDGKTRKVDLLYGEAYFEVSPSTNHGGANFIVNSADQEVKVLGTEFNIKAFKEEDVTYTTLVEGVVAVTNGVNSQQLEPEQQSRITRNSNEIDVRVVDVYNEISWRNGVFSFKQKSLQDIIIVLSRWYDADIVLENKEVDSIPFNGVLRKDQRLEEILEIISSTNDLTYEINNKKVILK